jgi:Tol biopolymer transport system component
MGRQELSDLVDRPRRHARDRRDAVKKTLPVAFANSSRPPEWITVAGTVLLLATACDHASREAGCGRPSAAPVPQQWTVDGTTTAVATHCGTMFVGESSASIGASRGAAALVDQTSGRSRPFPQFTLVADAAATPAANGRRTAVEQIAFAVHHGDGDAPWDIYVVRTDGRWVVKTTTKGLQEDDPVWSPDGRHIAFDGWTNVAGADTSIYTMNPDGTHRRRIARGHGPQWSPDGRRIAYDGSNGVYVINVDGTGKKRVARGSGPRWSPEGKQIAFTRQPGDVYVVNPSAGGERRVTRTGGDSTTETWAPDGRIVFSHTAINGVRPASGVYIINADGSTLRRVLRTSDYDTPTIGGWSADGKLLLYVGPHGISTWRPSDGSVRRLTRSSADGYPAWDRSGREIAFARNGIPRTRGIWTVNRDGSKARRVAVAPNWYRFGGPNEYSTPSWAPR